jgi:hypothetical protein
VPAGMSAVHTVAMWRQMHCCQTVRGPLTCTERADFGQGLIYGTVKGVLASESMRPQHTVWFSDVFLSGHRIRAYFLLISTDDSLPCAKTMLA